jgi:hypothetical protein
MRQAEKPADMELLTRGKHCYGIFYYSVGQDPHDPALSVPLFALLRKGPVGARLQGYSFSDY